MRTLFLLRGAPGSGKSTWVDTNDLETYTLCADQIRTGYKIVPDHVIQKMYSVFNSESKQIRNAFTTISPEDAVKLIQNTNDQVKDFNSWEKIYIFGDIHGCFEPIKSFF